MFMTTIYPLTIASVNENTSSDYSVIFSGDFNALSTFAGTFLDISCPAQPWCAGKYGRILGKVTHQGSDAYVTIHSVSPGIRLGKPKLLKQIAPLSEKALERGASFEEIPEAQWDTLFPGQKETIHRCAFHHALAIMVDKGLISRSEAQEKAEFDMQHCIWSPPPSMPAQRASASSWQR